MAEAAVLAEAAVVAAAVAPQVPQTGRAAGEPSNAQEEVSVAMMSQNGSPDRSELRGLPWKYHINIGPTTTLGELKNWVVERTGSDRWRFTCEGRPLEGRLGEQVPRGAPIQATPWG